MSTKASSSTLKPAATTTSNSIYSWDDQKNIGEFSVLTSECDRNKEELSTLNVFIPHFVILIVPTDGNC